MKDYRTMLLDAIDLLVEIQNHDRCKNFSPLDQALTAALAELVEAEEQI